MGVTAWHSGKYFNKPVHSVAVNSSLRRAWENHGFTMAVLHITTLKAACENAAKTPQFTCSVGVSAQFITPATNSYHLRVSIECHFHDNGLPPDWIKIRRERSCNWPSRLAWESLFYVVNRSGSERSLLNLHGRTCASKNIRMGTDGRTCRLRPRHNCSEGEYAMLWNFIFMCNYSSSHLLYVYQVDFFFSVLTQSINYT